MNRKTKISSRAEINVFRRGNQMSKVVGKVLIIEQTAPAKCTVCGELAELRPYGKDGAEICFPCAMKDLETTKEMFHKATENVSIFEVSGDALLHPCIQEALADAANTMTEVLTMSILIDSLVDDMTDEEVHEAYCEVTKGMSKDDIDALLNGTAPDETYDRINAKVLELVTAKPPTNKSTLN